MFKSNLTYAAIISASLLTSAQSFSGIPTYTQDFETMGVASEDGNNDIENDGWIAAGAEFDGVPLTFEDGNQEIRGTYTNFYSAASTSNSLEGNWTQIKNEEANNAGETTKYLNTFSDYGNGDIHQNPPASVNSLIFKQFTIDASDIGKIVTFTFDVKRPAIVDEGLGDVSSAAGVGCTNTCLAGAFFKTIDPSNNYAQTNYVIENTINASQSEWQTRSIVLDLANSDLEGQFLQFGFENFATNYDNTGVFYDNLSLTLSEAEPEAEPANVPIPTIALFGFCALLAWSGMSSIRKRLS